MSETQGQLLDKLDDKICSKGEAVEDHIRKQNAFEEARRRVMLLDRDIQYILGELRKIGKGAKP